MIRHPCEHESEHQVCGLPSRFQDRNGRKCCTHHMLETYFKIPSCNPKPIEEPMNTNEKGQR